MATNVEHDCLAAGALIGMGGGAAAMRGHRMHILASLLAALGLLLSASGAFARELTISHQWPEGTDARDRAARLFAQEVQLRAPELTFRIYPKLSRTISTSLLLAHGQTSGLS